VYPYQSLYELVGTKMRTPWNLNQRVQRAHFPVISEWVSPTDEKGSCEKRLMRNVIAHNFRTGMFYKDEEGYLADNSENDNLAQDENEFSASKLWRILERHLPALVEDLERAVELFGEEKGRLPTVLAWKEKVVVEDMAVEDPLEWSEDGDWGDNVDEGAEDGVLAWELVVEGGSEDEAYGSEFGSEPCEDSVPWAEGCEDLQEEFSAARLDQFVAESAANVHYRVYLQDEFSDSQINHSVIDSERRTSDYVDLQGELSAKHPDPWLFGSW